MNILPKLQLQIIDRDLKGNVIHQSKFMDLNTPVGQWLDILCINLSGVTTNVRDYSNTVRSYAATNIDNANCIGAANSVTQGIILGTGTTAVALGDYKVETPIANGTGAGQLTYGATSLLTAPTVSGSSKYFELTRAMINSSGGDINVTEVGLYYFYTYVFCLERSLNSHTITNGTSSTYVYRFTLTV